MRKQYHFWPGDGGLDAWDVDRLIELTKDHPVEEVPLSDIRELDSSYWCGPGDQLTVREIVEHFCLTSEADLSYPIILGPDGRVMDGMHRVARALLEGRKRINAVRLSPLPPPDHTNCHPDELPY
ncbi:MAG: hypothetical protein ACRDV4_02085 [Acidimicrobiales bacterium]